MIKSRNTTLDIARAISMLYIIGIYHLMENTEVFDSDNSAWWHFLRDATLGVFMFLSAYLLGKKHPINNMSDYFKFLFNRFIRLFPLFFISLFSYYIFGFITGKELIFSLTGISVFYPPQPPTLWFVSMLFVFYYIFPLLGGRSLSIQITVTLAIIMIAFYADSIFHTIDSRLFYFLPCFSLGAILSRYELNKFIYSWKTIIIGTILFIVFSLTIIHGYVIFYLFINRALMSIAGIMAILGISETLSRYVTLSKISYYISYASMCAYIFHRQIWDVIEKYIYWPPDGIGRLLYLIIIVFGVTMIAGYFIQWFYDKILAITMNKFNPTKKSKTD